MKNDEEVQCSLGKKRFHVTQTNVWLEYAFSVESVTFGSHSPYIPRHRGNCNNKNIIYYYLLAKIGVDTAET